ncbi:unnamed protein product, partial [Ectocarpus fasciculatus]
RGYRNRRWCYHAPAVQTRVLGEELTRLPKTQEGGEGCTHEEHGRAQPRWFDVLDRTHCFEGCGARLNMLTVFMRTM